MGFVSEEQAVREVLARYVRATDRRDGAALGALFADDAEVRILIKSESGYDQVNALVGRAAIADAVGNLMEPHPPGGSGHHLTADHIVSVDGDDAHLSAQVVVFQVRDAIVPIESGYYDTRLRRVDDAWLIVGHDILLDRSAW
jgi:ketosteroid isomerase-like protein